MMSSIAGIVFMKLVNWIPAVVVPLQFMLFKLRLYRMKSMRDFSFACFRLIAWVLNLVLGSIFALLFNDIVEVFFPDKKKQLQIYCKPYIYWQCQLIIPGVHCHRN